MLAAACTAALADNEPTPQVPAPAAVDASPPAAEPNKAPPTPARTDFEGAFGPVISINPEYQGAARTTTKVIGGIFIRWGRYTITNTSGFVTRRDDDVMRGLAADLVKDERWRVNLALRIDRGRASKDSAALSGLEDVRATVRGRLIVTRAFDEGWSTTLGTSVDMLARGGGALMDLGVSKAQLLPLEPPWRKVAWSVGLGVTAASQRYMQSYFGITAQQAANTGYAEYKPSSGLRDGSLGISLRGEFGNRWVGYVGASTSRLLGPARASPLSQQRSSWGVNGGVAWRF